MTRRPIRPFTLPTGWPQRVRSAVIHALSLARTALLLARGQAGDAHSRTARLQHEILLLREELRLKDARMSRVPAQRRPHYLPTERLALLELRAVRGWSSAQTAHRMLVSALTIASWMSRLDEDGPDALIQMRGPVNRFPEFVSYLVRRLKTLCPSMGKVRIANVLARAGLHLSATTVARMLSVDPTRPPEPAATPHAERRLRATRPNDIWHVDLTTVPTASGFWLSWLPWALPQRWPFCWWVGVVVDHFSRRVVGYAVFTQNPTSVALRQLLGRIVRQVGAAPAHLITDHGSQFTEGGFRRWCRRRGIRQRFGAVGRYGSIAVVERLIRTLKAEALRHILVPLDRSSLCREMDLIVRWYNQHRPHSALQAATPDELYFHRRPAAQAPRIESRRHWPRGSPCAAPHAEARGRRGQPLELSVTYLAGRRHLPIVSLKNAA